jgi:sigma-B regulation protein RsbU (phosphoserine phosphatase)
MKILIAEDDNIARRLLTRNLEKWGYEVVATRNGKEALETFRKGHFSMVITDWMMPEMDGLQLVSEIRNAETSDYVYIIMLTANSKKEDLVKGMSAGADDFIAKPFENSELKVRLRAGERIIGLEKKLFQRNVELEKINHRMRMDLQAAADIQKSLLPQRPPKVPGLQIEWEFRPCDELAGDILNVFKLSEDKLGFYVLDVSGHGVTAALLAVSLSRLLSPELDSASILKSRDAQNKENIHSPAQVVTALNKRFQMTEENAQFFTILYGIIDLKTLLLTYASAGHPAMIQINRNGSGEILHTASMPIGFLEENVYENHQNQLKAGDRIYIYSDGLPEAENPHRELFGNERMLKKLQSCCHFGLKESITMLMVDVNVWANAPLKDDVSVLGIEITG